MVTIGNSSARLTPLARKVAPAPPSPTAMSASSARAVSQRRSISAAVHGAGQNARMTLAVEPRSCCSIAKRNASGAAASARMIGRVPWPASSAGSCASAPAS
jgi:hypothetical protein